MDTSRGSLNDDRVAPEPTIEKPTSWSDVKRKMEFTMMQLVDKFGYPDHPKD